MAQVSDPVVQVSDLAVDLDTLDMVLVVVLGDMAFDQDISDK